MIPSGPTRSNEPVHVVRFAVPRQFAALTLIALFPLTAGAAGPSPLVAPNSDVMLALKVTAALQADPALKDFTLTVDVVRGVATVGGEVPGYEVAAAVRAAAAKVPGLAGVVTACRVPAGDDPFHDRVRAKLSGEPTAKVVTPDLRAATHVTAYRPTAPAYGLESAATSLRDGDERFARLTLAFDAGVVVVTGRAACHADATALLLALRKLPGVTRVRRGSIDAAE